MIFLEDVVHLCDVLAGHGFDYKAMVVAGQEAVPKAALGVAVERGAPRQGVLGIKPLFNVALFPPGNRAGV